MKRNISYLISLLCLFSGCLGFVIKENIVGNYYLIATDSEEDLGLCYHAPNDGSNYGVIIGATVYAVGNNEKYIIVKQHPRNFPNPPNKDITNYFILPIKNGFDWKNKNGLIGPLTLEQFNKKRKELDIPSNLTFTKEMQKLK